MDLRKVLGVILMGPVNPSFAIQRAMIAQELDSTKVFYSERNSRTISEG